MPTFFLFSELSRPVVFPCIERISAQLQQFSWWKMRESLRVHEMKQEAATAGTVEAPEKVRERGD